MSSDTEYLDVLALEASAKTEPRIAVSDAAGELLDRPARLTRGSSEDPVLGKDVFTAPLALQTGKSLLDNCRKGTWTAFYTEFPGYKGVVLTDQDRALLQGVNPPSSATVPLKSLADWDRLALRCFSKALMGRAFLEGSLVKLKELWTEQLQLATTDPPLVLQNPLQSPLLQFFAEGRRSLFLHSTIGGRRPI